MDDHVPESSRFTLWPGDPGSLPLDVRRTLIALLRGPYLSHRKDPILWSALCAHETVIRERLGDLLLSLAIDADAEVAFCRNLEPDPDFTGTVPTVLRRQQLTFVDSALVLHLRQLLLRGAARGERVMVGLDEITAAMQVYAPAAGNDEALFAKRLNAAIDRMRKYSILLDTDTEQRWEVSPILGLILTSEEISGIEAEYEELKHTGQEPTGTVADEPLTDTGPAAPAQEDDTA